MLLSTGLAGLAVLIVAGALAGAALLHWRLWAGLVVERALVLLGHDSRVTPDHGQDAGHD